MKLQKLLVLAFLSLTLIPIVLVSLLLYKSGFELSRESYYRNLAESITVQEDYISQTIENNMIADYRFINRHRGLILGAAKPGSTSKEGLLAAFQFYLETSEDKITASLLMDKEGKALYTIGEKTALTAVHAQLPKTSELAEELLSGQVIMEFKLNHGLYGLGIVTPLWDSEGVYAGCLVSVYNELYIFKIISSYYKIADTATYICREKGGNINFRKLQDEEQNAAIEEALKNQVLKAVQLAQDGRIDIMSGSVPILGYYKHIRNTPWLIVGFIDDALVYSFTNRFVLVYILVIFGVFAASLMLAYTFSRKVVEPIKELINVMESYRNGLNMPVPPYTKKMPYFEIGYLWDKFTDLMRTIMLVRHNFEGVYQLYHSSDLGDTNIDIDTKKQTVVCNKLPFQQLMSDLPVKSGACVVERFVGCFCPKDQELLLAMFEKMRDEHLSIPREAEIYTPHMNEKWFHALVVPMYENDHLSRLFIQLRDISAFKKQEFESIEQARRDPLTGLYNRNGFAGNVNMVLQSQQRSDLHGLLFLDMDYFKLVNDNFGHSSGDELLHMVAGTLTSVIGPRGVAARIGGDEFAVFLPHTTIETIEEVRAELGKCLVFPFQTDTTRFVVSASIGMATWQYSFPLTLDEMLQQADTDMYQAKRHLKQQNAQQGRDHVLN